MAGLIPQPFINDLLARIDIVAVIDARVPLKKAGKNYQARCPFHDEKTPSFSVSPDKQFYKCFGCGVAGTALTFLLEHDRMEFVEAVEALAAMAGVEVPRESGGRRSRAKDGVDRDALYRLMARASRYFRSQLKIAPHVIDYLKARGLTGEVARDFGMGFAPDGWDGVIKALDVDTDTLLQVGLVTQNDKGRTYDRFRNRVMFPIRDVRGRVIAFGGRVLPDDDGPKYLNSPETVLFQKHQELYGLFEAREALRQVDRFIMVEGYMDVVALAQSGISNAIATLGTASGEPHFTKLFRHANEVVCCFDGDNAGRQAAWRALDNALGTLKDGRQLKFMFLPDGEDPDSLVRKEGRERFNERVAQAQPAGEYLFARLSTGIELDSMDGRAQLAELAKPLIDKVPAGALERLMRVRLAELTGIATTGGRSEVRPVARKRPANSRVSEYLLSVLLRHPEFLTHLSPEQVQTIGSHDTLLGQVVSFIAGNGPIETVELLGHWSGEPGHKELIQLSERPLIMKGEGLVVDFVQRVSTYQEMMSKTESKRLLGDENFDIEKLEKLMSLRRERDSGDSPSTSSPSSDE